MNVNRHAPTAFRLTITGSAGGAHAWTHADVDAAITHAQRNLTCTGQRLPADYAGVCTLDDRPDFTTSHGVRYQLEEICLGCALPAARCACVDQQRHEQDRVFAPAPAVTPGQLGLSV